MELPEGPYETVAGFMLSALGHLPGEGESAEIGGRRLTVAQMDGRRIARLRVSQAAAVPAPAVPAPAVAAPAAARKDGDPAAR